MSRAELLQRAARVLQVTRVNWEGTTSPCGIGRASPDILIDTTHQGLRDAPRMVSSRFRARMRRDRIAPALSTHLIL